MRRSDPNCDTVSTFIINSYEPDANNGVSFALNGKQIYLATNDKNSSFAFKSKTPVAVPHGLHDDVPRRVRSTTRSPTCFYRVVERDRRRSTGPPPATYNDGSRRLLRTRSPDSRRRQPEQPLRDPHVRRRHVRRSSATYPPSGRPRAARSSSRPNIPIPSICVKKVRGAPDVSTSGSGTTTTVRSSGRNLSRLAREPV